MTSFTALHRLLGRPPGPVTSEMVDDAIAERLAEATELDFKSELPPTANLAQTDFPKDIAAMANSGGGTILYGVTEDQKRATGRQDVGELTENHERTLRKVTITAVSPPIFDLEINRVGETGHRCVAITVTATRSGPHLIYKNDYFGAPRRNDADTAWMDEPQIEAMYRARFDRNRELTEQLDRLYAQTARGHDTRVQAWLIAAATPQLPAVRVTRMNRDEARTCFEGAARASLDLGDRRWGGVRPLDVVDLLNPRTGLRSWIAPTTTTEATRWRESTAGITERGAVTLVTAVGGHPYASQRYLAGHEIEATAVECAVADFLGLLRAAAENLGTSRYDVQIGIEWAGSEPLSILSRDPRSGFPIQGHDAHPFRFASVRSTIEADSDPDTFHRQAHEVALDCVNQGGIVDTIIIPAPPASDLRV